MNITELKELAEKATPGPMDGASNGHLIDIPVRATDLEKAGISLAYIITDSPHRREVAKANARLIAAARAAILELITQLEETQHDRDSWEQQASARTDDVVAAYSKLEDAQGEIRALRATEAGLRDQLAALEKAIMDAEPVASMTVTMGEVTSMAPIAEMPEGTHPLYTLNGIKK